MFNHPLRQEYWGNPSHRAISECDGGLWHTGVHSIGQWPRILLHDQPTMFQRKDMRTLFIRGTKLISVHVHPRFNCGCSFRRYRFADIHTVAFGGVDRMEWAEGQAHLIVCVSYFASFSSYLWKI